MGSFPFNLLGTKFRSDSLVCLSGGARVGNPTWTYLEASVYKIMDGIHFFVDVLGVVHQRRLPNAKCPV